MHSGLEHLKKIHKGAAGKRIAFVSGNFNVVHPGHIRLLNFARSLADVLVVALLSENPYSYVPEELRLGAVRALDMVDAAFVMQDDLDVCLDVLKPDIVVKGAEHETAENPEDELVRAWGGRVVFCTDDPRFSLDELYRGMLQGRTQKDVFSLPKGYLERHAIRRETLIGLLKKMGRLKVCVLGDLIIDQYVICKPLGMSREDPTLVVSPLEELAFVGGAGIVAGHAAKMAGEVHLLAVTGQDEAAEFARGWLGENNVHATMIADASRHTTVKRRYRAQNKTLLRVNRLSQQQIDRDIQKNILARVDELLEEMDLLIFSDFSYGVLPKTLVEKITARCRQCGVSMTADSQTSSQVGDLGKFKHALLVAPTEIEARHAVDDFSLGLTALSQKLMADLGTKNCLITLAEDGCLISGDPDEYTVFTDNLPALNSNPVDVAGAGDSLLTVASLAMAAGGDVWNAALLGSLAAAIQVGRIGNIPLSTQELCDGVEGMEVTG